ncbi:MAG TPA: asparagine synthase-related protein, partial [Thermoanaerobaculia bacterium]|nr:asparagine synthase-related protein [Thermoanaerobaculia bacterium]
MSDNTSNISIDQATAGGGTEGFCGIWDFSKGGVASSRIEALSSRGFSMRSVSPGLHLSSKGFEVHESGNGSSRGCLVFFAGRLDNLEGLESFTSGGGEAGDICEIFEKRGVECFRKLEGDFTLLVFDKEENRLFLVRDFAGTRPIHYTATPGGFVFGSSIATILKISGRPPEPNLDHLAWYMLRRSVVDDSATFFEQVYSVPTSHYAEILDSRIEIKRYWDFEPDRREEAGSYDSFVVRFRELFENAVRKRLVDHPGIQVSGGLDSSSIYAVAKRSEMGGRLYAISYIAPVGSAGYEENYLERLEEDFRDRVERVPAPPPSLCHNIGGQVRAMEAPFLQYDYILDMFMTARSHGCQTLLSGFMGDQMMIDDSYLVDFVRRGDFRTVLAHFKTISASFANFGAPLSRMYRQTTRELASSLCPQKIKRLVRRVRPRPARGWFTSSF